MPSEKQEADSKTEGQALRERDRERESPPDRSRGGGGLLLVLAPCLVALLAVGLRFDRAVLQLGHSLGLVEPREKWFGMHPHETTLYSGRSEFQSIVVVKWRGDITLYIDGFSQFSSREEFRYVPTPKVAVRFHSALRSSATATFRVAQVP